MKNIDILNTPLSTTQSDRMVEYIVNTLSTEELPQYTNKLTNSSSIFYGKVSLEAHINIIKACSIPLPETLIFSTTRIVLNTSIVELEKFDASNASNASNALDYKEYNEHMFNLNLMYTNLELEKYRIAVEVNKVLDFDKNYNNITCLYVNLKSLVLKY